jgi:glycosyltransferase involved in cell wall biosynthesis
MNIALLHYAAPPIIGGVENVIGHHARLMARSGHNVRIIAGRGEQIDPHIEFIPIPLTDSRHTEILALKKALDQGQVPPSFDKTVDDIRGQLIDALRGVDILIAHNVCSLHKNLALTAALAQLYREMGSPRLVAWHHDLAWTTPRYRDEMHDDYPWNLLRQALPGVLQVVISQMRQRELAELFRIDAASIKVIPNGVDLGAFFKLEPQTEALVDSLNLIDAAPLLLLPVRITPRKNIELAIRVIAVLRSETPDAALVITGPPGPHNPANAAYFDDLKRLRTALGLEASVHFLAEKVDADIPDAMIADFFRLADALLFPSREEGFGIPVLEAALSGLPMFCADIEPLRQLAGDSAAYFSPDAEPDSVAEMIMKRLGDDPVYHMKVRTRQEYSWGGVYERHIAPFLETAGRHAS